MKFRQPFTHHGRTDGHAVPIFLLFYSVEFAQERSTERTFLIAKTRAVKQQRLACNQDVSSSNLDRDIDYLRVKIATTFPCLPSR